MAIILSMILPYAVLTLLLFFAFTTLWYRDKLIKAKDELLELANKNDFFRRKSCVMNPSELQLFRILQKLYGETYYIFPQMSLSNVLDIHEDFKDHDNLWREIDHRSLDYVFFDKQELSPILALELNGDSHKYFSRKNRDRVFEDIFQKAKIRFHCIQRVETYDEALLKQKLDQMLNSPTTES